LFENITNYIKDLCIINLNSDKNIRFNFSNKSIINSYLDNFNDFTRCGFNENTKFINSTILNIKLDSSADKISKNQFIDCSFDSTFDTSFQLKETNKDSYNEALKIFLNQFFKLFFSNGRLGRQWEHKVISPRFSGINKLKLDYNNFIKLLKKQEIIEITIELNKPKFAINEKAKEAVIKYTKDGTVDKIIMDIFNHLKK
jgi:hypothetical protein